ncbi:MULTISPECIES: hypothetical protein [Pseudomonas]|jgi:hypothetical protein|uniref:hypothetical protein n=1 Tax=Pseudomonas TaxID=286 RepID=UPI0012E9B7A2|nr:hypothetical protein [Pseudomonas sp. FH1]MBK3431955.1 hypothetical protein [Pseudomonas fluorescens]
MGDFERTFGAGANLDSIIDGYNRDYRREQRSSGGFSKSRIDDKATKTFPSFQEAMSWAKANPGQVITRIPGQEGFMVKSR